MNKQKAPKMEQYKILSYFEYAHLPPSLQAVSKPFCDLAQQVAGRDTNNPAEVATCLRKLLEAKDCAVRGNIVV